MASNSPDRERQDNGGDSSYIYVMRTTLTIAIFSLSLLGACTTTHFVLPSEQEQLQVETAAQKQAPIAEKLPLDADSIYPALERFLVEHPEVYGWTFAIDPAYAGKPLAPYVYRQGSKLIRVDLAKATRTSLRRAGMLTNNEKLVRRDRSADDYNYPTQAWFIDPVTQRKAMWSDAYFDAGGGEAQMVTYSVPVEKDGRIIGVLAADCELHPAMKKDKAQ